MSDAYLQGQRYGHDFVPFANGVDSADWPALEGTTASELVVRYAGGACRRRRWPRRSARCRGDRKSRLRGSSHSFRNERQEQWKLKQGARSKGLTRTSFEIDRLPTAEYRNWLSSAGALLIAYNFDDNSLRYIGLSMANKLPECLASGAPVVVYGPEAAATVSYAAAQNCALVISKLDLEHVKAGLLELLDGQRRQQLAARGREVAFEQFDLERIRTDFMKAMANAAQLDTKPEEPTGGLHYPRSVKMGVDETKVVAELFADARGKSHVMFDVGAHTGTSAKFFDALDWSIYCFEPNDENRAQLTKKFCENPQIVKHRFARCGTGGSRGTGRSFFVSEESTGIGTLHAFRDSHEVASTVDVTTVDEVARQHA